LDGYSLKQLFVSYDESNIPTIEEEAIYLLKEEAKCGTF
jgi:hypothetical protein